MLVIFTEHELDWNFQQSSRNYNIRKENKWNSVIANFKIGWEKVRYSQWKKYVKWKVGEEKNNDSKYVYT